MFTYLFKRQSDGLVKIGKSSSPISRIESLSRTHGKLDPLAVMAGDVEIKLHRQFHGLRIKGEWFSLGDQDISIFANSEDNLITYNNDGNPILPGSIYENNTNSCVNLKIDEETHRRLKMEAAKNGRLVGHLASELINAALDAITRVTATKP
jgi:hypothetical protein